MGKEISVFKTEEVLSRIVNIYGTPEEPLFLAKEVAEWIEYDIESVNKLIAMVDTTERLTGTIFRSGQNRDMWFLTEDGFYEVLMQSRKPIAKQFKSEVKKILKDIRKHGFYGTDQFVENALSDPDTLITILQNYKTEREERLLAQQAVLQLEEKVEADKPKVLFADSVTTSKTEILVGELAKLLKQNGVCIGQNRLFQWLRDHGYLMKGGSSKNMPTQQSMDLGLMNIKERAIINPDGSNRITKTPKITGKGQLYFVNKFLRGNMPATITTMTALEKGRKYLSLLGTNEKGSSRYSFKPVVITSHLDYTIMVSPDKIDASQPPEVLVIHNLALEKLAEKTDRGIIMPNAIINRCGGITPEELFAVNLYSLPRTESGMVIWEQK